MGAQIVGLQAGYSFASTVDPNSGADSTVLISLAQIVAGMLFFSLGLDHQILQAFARSLSVHPPGQFSLSLGLARQVVDTGASVFSTGLRLVLPVVALLVMVDISLALLARLNSQLQLITLAFPIKMLVSLALLAWLTLVFPKMLAQSSVPIMKTVQRLLN
jgi:flagellar biosynthetic protein FliR